MSAEARGIKRVSPEHGTGDDGRGGDGEAVSTDQVGAQLPAPSRPPPQFKRKRTHPNTAGPQGIRDPTKAATTAAQTRPIGRAFAQLSAELDRFQERRERLIKLSRDVTALSKKLIVHLHRWEHADVELSSSSPPSDSADPGATAPTSLSIEEQALVGGRQRNAKLLEDAHRKLKEIVAMLKEGARAEALAESHVERSRKRIVAHGQAAQPQSSEPSPPAARSDRDPDEQPHSRDSDEQPVFLATRYDRAFGPGIEEFIEAASFLHYLEHDRVITLEEVQSHFLDNSADEEGREPSAGGETKDVILRITPERYVLGLSDLTGELMRYATNALSSPAAQKANVVPRTLQVLRTLSEHFEPFVLLLRDFQRKQNVTDQNVRKIEQLSYSLTVRSVEFGSDPGTLAELVRRSLAAASGSGGADRDGAEGEE